MYSYSVPIEVLFGRLYNMNNGLKPIPKPIGMPTELPKIYTYCAVHTIYSLVLLMLWEFSVYIHIINCLLIESIFHKCHFSKAS